MFCIILCIFFSSHSFGMCTNFNLLWIVEREKCTRSSCAQTFLGNSSKSFLTNTAAITLKEYEWNYITVIVIATVKWWAKLQNAFNEKYSNKRFSETGRMNEGNGSNEWMRERKLRSKHAYIQRSDRGKMLRKLHWDAIYRYFRYLQSFMHFSICYESSLDILALFTPSNIT